MLQRSWQEHGKGTDSDPNKLRAEGCLGVEAKEGRLAERSSLLWSTVLRSTNYYPYHVVMEGARRPVSHCISIQSLVDPLHGRTTVPDTALPVKFRKVKHRILNFNKAGVGARHGVVATNSSRAR